MAIPDDAMGLPGTSHLTSIAKRASAINEVSECYFFYTTQPATSQD